MISGVIFDMDGLMTDTERLFLNSWCEIMKERGLPEHRDVVIHCIGLNHAATQSYVKEQLGEEFDYSGVMQQIGLRSRAYCDQYGVPVKDGLYTLLDALDAEGIPYVVATSTVRENAVRRLTSIGVYERLRGLVAGDMVKRGKPDPEIFIRAAELLSIPPEECVVLEDSPHGILAAYRAGCKPIMIPDLKKPNEATKSLLFDMVERLDDVIPVLKKARAV